MLNRHATFALPRLRTPASVGTTIITRIWKRGGEGTVIADSVEGFDAAVTLRLRLGRAETLEPLVEM
jgi:hypothetical protein